MKLRSMVPLLGVVFASCTAAGDEVSLESDVALATEVVASLGSEGRDSVVHRAHRDALGQTHVRFRQTVGGVPVFGGESIVHVHPDGATSVTNDFVRAPRVDLTPSITEDVAVGVALAEHGGDLDDLDVELVVLRRGADHLAWKVAIRDLRSASPSMPVLFVDAHTGGIVWRFDNLQTVKDRETYDAMSGFSLPGVLERIEGSVDIGDKPVDDAHNHAGSTHDYYLLEQGRDSFDGLGATLISSAHYGNNYENAFWDGTQMVYGDGKNFFRPLSGDIDVVAHELTHAVTEHTAALIYAEESGGLNEATSDILGTVIENYANGWVIDGDTWLIGEDITKTMPALRYMDDPTLDGVSIDSYLDYFSGIDVHFSSGIANKAFYLFATDPAFTVETAGDVWYRALVTYMTPDTSFSEAREATVLAAADLYGDTSAQVAAVEAAWDAVDVTEPKVYSPYASIPGLSGGAGSEKRFAFTLPAGAVAMEFSLAGGDGNVDLYVGQGFLPTTFNYTCRSNGPSEAEVCDVDPASGQTLNVLVRGATAYKGSTLTAAHFAGTFTTEQCVGGLDDDADGQLDCLDPDCAADPICALPEACSGALDEDLDGAVDCDDSDCLPDAATCPRACAGGVVLDTIAVAGGSAFYQVPVAASGTFEASVVGPIGADFDLLLQRRQGNKWVTAASSRGLTSNEIVSYEELQVVDHRWKITSFTGSGDFELCVE